MLPDYPASFWFIAALALILVGIGKAGFGGGVGIVATPLLALVVPVSDAAALLLPLLIVADMFAINHYRTRFDRESIKIMLPGAALGIAIGSFFFGYFSNNERALQIVIGVLALVFVFFQLGRAAILGAASKREPHRVEGTFWGTIAGFTSTLAHAGGPPAVVYLLPLKLPKDVFVGTTVILFAAINLIKLIPYYFLGLLKVGNLTTILVISPLAFLGIRLGIYLNQRFSDHWFNRIVYTVLFLTGVELLLGNSLIGMFLAR
jgi:uncharacterized membrane protein YfcA